jgi:Fe-S-cluster-containing dehydrogenase component
MIARNTVSNNLKLHDVGDGVVVALGGDCIGCRTKCGQTIPLSCLFSYKESLETMQESGWNVCKTCINIVERGI